MTIMHALLRNELRLFVSLALWVTRRTHGTGGGQAFGYARGQGAMMFGLAFVCGVETVGMAVLLRNWPVAHAVALVLDLYTVFVIVGLHAATVTRPHVLTDSVLRVRRAAHVDLRIPLRDIAAVRRELRTTHEPRAGELNLDVGAQTSVTLELTAPVAHFTLFGRHRNVRVVRLHADDTDGLVHALQQALTATPYAVARPKSQKNAPEAR